MAPALIAVSADWHLEGLRNIIPGESLSLQIETIRRIVQAAIHAGAQHLFVAGDVFDNSHPREETKIALGEVIRQSQQWLHWHIIPGNHDRPLLHQHPLKIYEWFNRTRWLPNLTVYLEPTLVECGGQPIWVCPHPFKDPPPREARFAVGHFAWTGARRDNGSAEEKGYTPEGWWVLGDFHGPQAGARHHYVGSPAQVEWIERGPRGFTLIHSDASGVQLRRQQIQAPYQLNLLPLRTLDDLQQLECARGVAHSYWKLLVPSELRLPDGWQARYPMVVDRGVLGRSERTRATVERVQFSDDPWEGAYDWFDERKNLTPVQMQWAVDYMRAHSHSVKGS